MVNGNRRWKIFRETDLFFVVCFFFTNSNIPLLKGCLGLFVGAPLFNLIPTCVLLNLLLLFIAGQWRREEASDSGHLQETQNTKEEEAKGPQ